MASTNTDPTNADDEFTPPTDKSKLTPTELACAKEIKQAVVEQDGPDVAAKLADLEYAQLAMVTKGKLKRALKMIRRLQTFKEDHGIDPATDTPESVLATIQQFERGSPGFFMSLGTNAATGRAVTVWRYAAFNPKNYHGTEEWKLCFAAFFYLLDAMAPDIATIREGMCMVCECEGMGWKNFSLEIEKHGAALYQDCYPVRFKEMTCLNAPVIFKAMYQLCKPFLSKHTKKILNMTGELEQVQETHPKDMLPTTLGGTQDTATMNDNLLKALKLRFETRASFKLED